MTVTITSASYGDERSQTNVLSSLKRKLQADGSLVASVDSSLLPIVQIGGTVSLSDDEVSEAKEKAINICGNANDTTCIEMKSQELQRQRLQEKENESQSSSNIIKGRRLTVVTNENGRERTYQVPDGQEFRLGKAKTADNAPLTISPSLFAGLSFGGVFLQIAKSLGIIVATFAYVFSVVITYKSFIEAGYKYLTYAATAASVLIPYSGFVITLLFFAVRTWVENILQNK